MPFLLPNQQHQRTEGKPTFTNGWVAYSKDILRKLLIKGVRHVTIEAVFTAVPTVL